MNESYKKHFAIGTAAGLLGTVGIGLANYFIRRYWAISLNSNDFGFFYSMYALIFFAGIAIDLGCVNYTTFEISKFNSINEKNSISQIFFSISIYKIMSGFAGTAIIWMAAPFLATHYFHYEQSIPAIRVMAFFFPAFCLEGHLFTVLCAFKSFAFAYGATLVKFVLILTAAAWMKPSAVNPPILFLCGSSLFCAAAFAYILLTGRITFHPKYWSVIDVLRHLKSGLWLAIFNIAAQAVLYIDLILVTVLKGVGVAAVYNIAIPVVQIIYSFLLIIPTVFLPLISSLWAKHGSEQAVADICKSIFYFMAALLWLVLLIIVPFSRQIIVLLFSEKYIQASPLLGFLCAGIILYTCGYFFLAVLNSRNRNHATSTIMLTAALLQSVLCAILISSMGLIGAAIATFITHGLICVTAFIILRIKMPFMKISLVRTALISIPGCGLLAAIICLANVKEVFSMQSVYVLACPTVYAVAVLPFILSDLRKTFLPVHNG